MLLAPAFFEKIVVEREFVLFIHRIPTMTVPDMNESDGFMGEQEKNPL